MRITDGARWAIEDHLAGLSRLDRVRMYAAAVVAKVQMTLVPVDGGSLDVALAHESELKEQFQEGENGPDQAD